MRILLLGGVAESRELAQQLIDQRFDLIYSIVGLVRIAQLDCEVHVGGFSSESQDGTDGLIEYCRVKRVDLVIDATHPYADQISANARSASRRAGIPCWRLTRPGWDQSQYPTWHDYHDMDSLFDQIAPYQRPFLSVGASILRHQIRRPPHQQWIVRSARPQSPVDGITLIEAIGPFNYDDELALLKAHRIDALVSKNSGCQRIIHKIDAAHSLGLPIYVQQRPTLPTVDAEFTEPDALVDALLSAHQ